MVLCNLCCSIPFQQLPSLPDCYRAHTEPGQGLILFIPQYGTTPDEQWGFPHQPSFEALQDAARECELCGLLQEAVSQFTKNLDTAQRDKDNTHGYKKAAPTNGRLRLTSRYSGEDGFMLWTDAQKAHVFLLGGVGLCAGDDNSPLAESFRGRPLEADPSSETALARAYNWVKKCDSQHKCRESDNMPLPTRVLDVGDHSSSSGIRLWETNGDARGQYTTLSYCWGKSEQFVTKISTMELRKEGIELKEMPKTFQDAVVITRGLNVRYLWIDSLCICQDDDDDWKRESAKMQEVYANSYLTIAAVSSSDGSKGCFIRRTPPKYTMFDYPTKDGITGQMYAFPVPLDKAARASDCMKLEGEPLTSRGWALQERLLSPRILHYASDQMFFECNQEFLSEDGYRRRGRFVSLDGISDPDSTVSRKDMRDLWNEVIDLYGPRKLTYQSDRLPALSGLAKRFQLKLKDKYIAGLWHSTLIGDLLWDSGQSSASWSLEDHRPSWSWLVANGIRSPMKKYRVCPKLATLVDYHVQVDEKNPYGEVVEGWIKLRVPTIPVSVADKLDKEKKETYPRFKTLNGDARGVATYLDYKMDEAALREKPLFAVVIGRDASDRSKIWYPGLIVMQTEEGAHRYRRLGYILMTEKFLGDAAPKAGATDFPVITLT